jgi:hypothetical protein
MMEIPWQDYVLVVSGLVGFTATAVAAMDEDTSWARKSSITKSASMFATAIALWTVGLRLSGTTAFGGALLWVAISVWRAPDSEN